MVELLKQPAYSPYQVERQVASLWAGTTGELDDVPVGDIRRFETEFLELIDREYSGVYDAIRQTGKLEDDAVEQLKKAIAALKSRFQTAEGTSLVKEPEREAMDAEDVGQEKVTRYQRQPAQQRGSGDAGKRG
jgi:F-type H+-transporting ATPase subunit alpha